MTLEHPPVTEHPTTLEGLRYQRETAALGMWVFLATEAMLFSGLFTAYAVYRYNYLDAFAGASRHLDPILGAINTGVLILSSLTMALAVQSAQAEGRNSVAVFMALTFLLGASFLGIKAVEYTHHFQEHLVPGVSFSYPGEHPQQASLFFVLYFAMTGVHGVHLLVGLGLVLAVTVRRFARRSRYSGEQYTPVELTGLYWHFVDVIWVFIFPLLYLIGRH